MCKFQFKVVKKSPFIQYNTDNIANNVNFTNCVLKLNKDITRLIRKQLKNSICASFVQNILALIAKGSVLQIHKKGHKKYKGSPTSLWNFGLSIALGMHRRC